jgi:acetyl/propionyl-CoA carboxylase alpha subunit
MTREGAINRMRRALEEMRIVGVSTTIPFHRFVMENETFKSGALSTAFVEEEFTAEQKEVLYKKALEANTAAFLFAARFKEKENQRKLFVK